MFISGKKKTELPKMFMDGGAPSSGSSVMVVIHKEITTEILIHHNIKPRQIHLSTILVVSLILIFLAVNMESIIIKVPIQA